VKDLPKHAPTNGRRNCAVRAVLKLIFVGKTVFMDSQCLVTLSAYYASEKLLQDSFLCQFLQ